MMNLVLALDAPWGEGKSTFIKMWRGYLKQEKVQSIYFDAFENDYQQDPFLAISSQIYQLIEQSDKSTQSDFKVKAVSALKVVGRAGLRIGIKALTAGVLDETVLEDTGNTSGEASDLIDGFVASQLTKAEGNRQCLIAFKEHLGDLAEKLGNGKPVIFIIDELDRCKPKFALSILESIKHLFSVPNITFVLAMNRQQLEESVRCEYGNGVDASKYLQKFVSVWASLPKEKDKVNSSIKKYLRYCLRKVEFDPNNKYKDDITIYENLATHYDLSLREIEKSLTSYAILNNSASGNLNFDYSWISIFISIIKTTRPQIYSLLLNDKITYSELYREASLDTLTLGNWAKKPDGHPIRWLLNYLLTNDEKSAEAKLLECPFQDLRMERGEIKTVCSWLEKFSVD